MANFIVVAPGRPISRDVADQVSSLFFEKFSHHQIDFDPQCFESAGHFAGTDDARLYALQKAMNSKDYDVVWLARGGYGACRLLNNIDFSTAIKDKVIIGYSDGCFLISAFYKEGFSNLIHGPMPIDITRVGGVDAINRIVNYIDIDMEDNDSIEVSSNSNISFRAPIFAANLNILTKMIGTKYFPNLDGHVLLIEDVAEHFYAIDRMLFQLINSIETSNIRGIILGSFTSIPENDVQFGESIIEMSLRWIKDKVPVGWGYPIGHTIENTPIKIGETRSFIFKAIQ